jgi:hypothetical protein
VAAVNLATGQWTPFAGTGAQGIAGDGGPASDALFDRIGGLTAVPGGGLLVADSFNHRVRYIAPESINLVGDAGLTEFHLPWVSALTGDLTVSDNPSVTVVSMGEVNSVAGAVSVTGNQAATVIDMSGLETVAGNITITDNGNATVSTTSLGSVAGSITIESSGMGTFSMSTGNVAGSAELALNGYWAVEATTAGDTTHVTLVNNAATMEVSLPDGAFSSTTPVGFTVTTMPGGEEVVDGQSVTHLARYAFDFAIPTLNSAAELNFQIDLAAMAEPDRLALVDLLHDDAVLTIGVLGEAPDAELQLFDVCVPGTDPMLDDCVTVRWLDANGAELDPTAGIDPDMLRFEALVGHFSTYSVVAVSSTFMPADIDQDGDVDRTDAAVFTQFFGLETGATWETGDFDGDFAATLYDLALLQAHLGQGPPSPSAAAVPEPPTLLMLLSAVALAIVVRPFRGCVPHLSAR